MSTIAIFLPSLSGGGAERVMLQLANEFSRQHRVLLIVCKRVDHPFERELNQRVVLIPLNVTRVSHSLLKLVRSLKTHRPDVLLTTLGHTAVVACMATKLLPRQSIRLIVRQAISTEFHVARATQSRAILLDKLIGWSYRHAFRVLAPTGAMAASIEHRYRLRAPVSIISNPTVGSDFEQKMQASLTVQLPWTDECPLILGVGRLTAQKDFTTLIRAFAVVRESIDVKLLILGEGDERKHLATLLQSLNLQAHAYLPGFVANPLPAFRRADLFVSSSRYEGLPNALIQAVACGTPCVATDCPNGPSDVLMDGIIGTLVPVGDSRQLADAIVQHIRDGRLPSNVVNRTRQLYSSRLIADRYLDLMLPAHSS